MFLNRLFVSTIFALGLASAAFAQNAAPAPAPTAEHIQLGREVVEASGAAKTFDQVIPVFIEQAKSSILGSNPDLSKDLTTVGLSEQLSRWQHTHRDIVFYIGSTDGLDSEFKKKADLAIRVSSLTLPHMMVRVLLVEQIYRAWSILNHHPYHRI